MSKSNPFGAPKITGTVSWEEAYTKYIMYDGELDGFMPASQYDQRRSDPAMLLDMAENPGAYGDMDVLPSRIIDVIFDLIRRINRLGSESVWKGGMEVLYAGKPVDKEACGKILRDAKAVILGILRWFQTAVERAGDILFDLTKSNPIHTICDIVRGPIRNLTILNIRQGSDLQAYHEAGQIVMAEYREEMKKKENQARN